MLLRHFQEFFQYCWEKLSVPFSQQTHKNECYLPSQGDKIGWFPSQLQSEQPASRRTTIFYIVRQNGRAKRPQIDPSVRGGGGGGGPLGKTKLCLR